MNKFFRLIVGLFMYWSHIVADNLNENYLDFIGFETHKEFKDFRLNNQNVDEQGNRRILFDISPKYSGLLMNFYVLGGELNNTSDSELIEIPENKILLTLNPMCMACMNFVKRVIKGIQTAHEQKKHQFWLKLLSNGCKLLKGEQRKLCTDFVLKQNSPLYNSLVKQLAPKLACEKAKLCRPKNTIL